MQFELDNYVFIPCLSWLCVFFLFGRINRQPYQDCWLAFRKATKSYSTTPRLVNIQMAIVFGKRVKMTMTHFKLSTNFIHSLFVSY